MKKFTVCFAVLGLFLVPALSFGQSSHRHIAPSTPVSNFRPQQAPAPVSKHSHAYTNPQHGSHQQSTYPVNHHSAHPLNHHPSPMPAPHYPTYPSGKPGHHHPTPFVPVPMPVPPAPVIIETQPACNHSTGSGFSLFLGGKHAAFQIDSRF